MSVARHAGSDNPAVQHVQCREQGGGAITLVVMRHGAGPPVLQWQARLGAIVVGQDVYIRITPPLVARIQGLSPFA